MVAWWRQGESVTRRRVAVAVLSAVLSAVLLWALIGGSDAPPDAGGSAVASVVRVARDVARGTPADLALADGSLVIVDLPADDPLVAEAVSSASLAGTVATRAIAAGGLLQPGAFTPRPQGGSVLAGRLPSAGYTALAVTLDATRAVGGWVRPGDRVNLLVPGQCADEVGVQALAIELGGEARCRRARFLYQAVEVLAVGGVIAGSGVGGASGGGGVGAEEAGADGGDVTGGGSAGGVDASTTVAATGSLTIVLALPPRASQWVATWENELTLTLVAPDYRPRVVDPLPTVIGRLPGEDAPTLRPDCRDAAAPGPAGELEVCVAEVEP